MIPVTMPYLPDRKKLDKYIDKIYASKRLTNNGELVRELTCRLEDYLGVENLLLVGNGTLALQVAYSALGLGAEKTCQKAITTPFSFIATSSSLKWQNIHPVFADIDSETWCVDPDRVEEAIDDDTCALVPVHVYGNACEIERLGEIAERHDLKIIYDGAHAFGVEYKGSSIFSHGDAATLSFHATKLFHTIEGGGVVFKNSEYLEIAKAIINFGLAEHGGIVCLGINCKMSEFQAAMGLCVLEEIDSILERRKEVCNQYRESLGSWVGLQRRNSNCSDNAAYFPVLFENELVLEKAMNALEISGCFPRRYFYPPLDSLEMLSVDKVMRQVSSNVSSRVLCLPVYPGLNTREVEKICELIKGCIAK